MAFRFWTWRNDGRIRLALSEARPRLQWETGHPTDEGYRFEATTWWLDGDVVRMETFSDETDCDGRLQFSGEYECRVDRLDAQESSDSVMVPAWTEEARSRRDFAAEAAGY